MSGEASQALSRVPCGAVFYVDRIHADPGLTKRLEEMGFVRQAAVVKSTDRGTIICRVGHTDVVVSEALADQIFVQPVAMPMPVSSEITLDKLKPGQKGRIVRFSAEGEDVLVLQEMGLTPHETVELVRIAPLGDPMELRIRGYELSLRRQQARQILVEPIA